MQLGVRHRGRRRPARGGSYGGRVAGPGRGVPAVDRVERDRIDDRRGRRAPAPAATRAAPDCSTPRQRSPPSSGRRPWSRPASHQTRLHGGHVVAVRSRPPADQRRPVGAGRPGTGPRRAAPPPAPTSARPPATARPTRDRHRRARLAHGHPGRRRADLQPAGDRHRCAVGGRRRPRAAARSARSRAPAAAAAPATARPDPARASGRRPRAPAAPGRPGTAPAAEHGGDHRVRPEQALHPGQRPVRPRRAAPPPRPTARAAARRARTTPSGRQPQPRGCPRSVAPIRRAGQPPLQLPAHPVGDRRGGEQPVVPPGAAQLLRRWR